MVDKRTTIIEKAIKLFAAKGYHSTSIQEIADACGIAKGTLYNYFESKDDVMLSVLKYYSGMIMAEVEKIANDQTLTSKEIFLKQIHYQLEECVKHRDFIEMHIREYAVPVNEEINDFLFSIRSYRIRWLSQCLLNVYGKGIEPFVLDLATMMNGVIREYLEYIILDKKQFDTLKLSKFLINRLDDSVNSLMNSGEYFLEYSDLEDFLKISNYSRNQLSRKLNEIIHEVVTKLYEDNVSAEIANKVKNTMEVIQDELTMKDEPKLVVVEGLLLILKAFQLAGFEQFWGQLEEVMNEMTV